VLKTIVQRLLDSDHRKCFWGVELINEPSAPKGIPVGEILEFYDHAYDMIREMSTDVSLLDVIKI